MPALNPSVWLDGAHNADKMGALAAELRQQHGDHQPLVVVLGVLGAKDARSMIAKLRGVASAIVATEPRVLGKRALPASSLAELVSKSGFDGSIVCEPDVSCAVAAARELAHEGGTDVMVTGSLYLVGEVRGRWYPNDEIVKQRTPWPEVALGPSSGVA
jgi:dihydrofolate synthase/folylpolyglutamate synthase